MTKTACVLDIMMEKEYIELEMRKESTNRVPIYNIKVSNKIHKYKLREEIKEKIENKIKNDSDFIVAIRFINGGICFAYKEDIEKIIQELLNSNLETLSVRKLTRDLETWINNNYKGIKASPAGGYTHITNLEIRENRKNREEKEDEEAINLLNSIL